LPLSSPKIKNESTEKYTKLEKKKWTATASVKDSLYLFSGDKIPIEVPAENAIDGDHWTGWRDMTKKQYGGQWFMVDMKKMQTFDKIELDNTWALWDSPKKYSVLISNDGKKWSNTIAEGTGPLGITHIVFPRQTARFIKIIQNGTDEKYNWSIFEMDVLRKN